MKIRLILLFVPFGLALFSCKEKEEDLVSATVEVDVHNGLASWKYFSFTAQDTVTVADPKTSIHWDLGIHYESFSTNGGASGSGQGAVYDLGAISYESVNAGAIDSLATMMVEDDSISVVVSPDMSHGPIMATVPGCPLMESMFASPAGPPPHTYAPNNHVYIIRTATGKYVKLLGVTFFNDLGTEGYLNMKYDFLN